MYLTEYDEEKERIRTLREGRNEGREEGRNEGHNEEKKRFVSRLYNELCKRKIHRRLA